MSQGAPAKKRETEKLVKTSDAAARIKDHEDTTFLLCSGKLVFLNRY